MAGANPANADGLTFDWTGDGNGTSFGRAANFSFGYDVDGNLAQDGDGNPVAGPPNGLDNMIVTTGTPTVSSPTRRILSLDVSGGQFIVRNSNNGGPSTFFVDGTLNLSGSGALNIGADERGASVLSVNTMVMTGGIVTDVDAPGILTITNSLSQSGGDVSQVTINTPSYALSGGTLAAPVNFTNLFSLSNTGTVESAAKLTGSDNTSAMTQSGGIMNGTVTGIASYTQSGGSLGGSVTTGTYDLKDATATSTGGTITASDIFALEPDSGTAIVDARLSGTGALVKSGASAVVLAGSNDFTGTVSINAGTLEVQNGAALADTAAVTIADTAGAKLLVTTSETIGSLAGGPASTVTIADGQTLTTGDATNTAFMGAMDGETGSLVKEGSGTFTIGGDAMLGGLSVNNGKLAIGTGTSTNTASFESATVAAGATLYVASGATLTIRIPNNLVNNGHLINDGTIVDDLDNNAVYDNHADNSANVASNTSIINNDTPDGVWTGDVLTNAGVINNYNIWTGNVVSNQFPVDFTYTGVINNNGVWTGDILSNNFLINNNADGTWKGDVVDNDYNIANAGGTWIGDVQKNSDGTIFNDGATAVWTGDVLTNDSQIVNTSGATWNGKVESNNSAIFNLAGSAWNGDVAANGGGSNSFGQILNYGAWTGAVNTNAGGIYNLAGSWTGNVLANTGLIVNNDNDENANPTGANHAVWTGDIASNDSQIINDHGGIWNGKILGNTSAIFNQTDATWNGDVVANDGGSNGWAQIYNYGAWTGTVDTNAGGIFNYGGWIGNVLANTGVIVNNDNDENANPTGANHAVWTGDIASNDSQIINDHGGIWNGKILGNTSAIFNQTDATWNGDVVANDGGSNGWAQIYNYGAWTGTVDTNAGGIFNYGGWTGNVLANTGGIVNNDNDVNANPTGANHAVWTGDISSNDGQIINDHGGTWTGKILGNTSAIFNQTDATWNGDVVANGGDPNSFGQILNYGAWTGTVDTNAGGIFNYGGWTGNVLANTGGIVNNDNDVNTNPTGANHAVWTGDIASNDGQIINDHGGTWTGKILGNNSAIFNQTDATWNGDVVANGGDPNSFAQIYNYGAWTGTVDTNAGWIFNLAGGWTGNVLANTGGIVNNDNDVNTNPTGANHAVWTGDIASNDGQIINDHGGTWTGKILGNNGAIFNQADATWNGDVVANGGGSNPDAEIDNYGTWTGDVLSNTGTINNAGIWNGDFTSAGTVNAENRINGAFDNSGVLQLTGSLSGITTLTNSGTLDMRNGSAAQTLTAASASFGANSFFNFDVDATGKSDQVVVTGAATLAGTVHVTAMLTAGPYADTTRYTILTADSITGTFAHVTTDLAFLAPRLSYGDGDVDLTLKRNDHGFAYAGVTRNQKATAGAAELLGAGNEIYDAVLWLTNDQAKHAFDDLSGEAYSSVASAFVQNASVVADVVTRRIDQTFDARRERGSATGSCSEGPAPTPNPKCNANLWAQFYGVHGNLAGNGDTAGVNSSTGGFAGGIDGSLGGWRSGVMVQAGGTSTRVSGLGSSSDSTDYGAGVYGGRQWGNTRLSLGAIYTRHDFRATRDVAFAGFTDDLSATYSAGTAQAFGKLSQEFDLGAVALRPYASLDYVNHDSDSFAETGGAAALNSAANVVDATFTTLGFGIDREFLIGDGMLLTAKGSLGWRHAFADTPSSDYRFAGGTSFSVVGAPIASDTAAVSAGLNLDVDPGNTFVVGYEGQIGDGIEIHALEGVWSIQF